MDRNGFKSVDLKSQARNKVGHQRWILRVSPPWQGFGLMSSWSAGPLLCNECQASTVQDEEVLSPVPPSILPQV